MSTLYGMSRIQNITSAANPLLREVRRAITRGERTADGLCVAEGFHLLEEALRSGREVPIVLTSESLRQTVDRQVRGLAATRTVVLPDALFQAVASTETSQGVMALVRPAEWSVEQVFLRRQPGGGAGWFAGSRQRRSGGARRGGVWRYRRFISERNRQRSYHPKTLRASAGSLFRVPFVAGLDAAVARATLRQHRVAIYAEAMPLHWRAETGGGYRVSSAVAPSSRGARAAASARNSMASPRKMLPSPLPASNR